MLSNTNHRRSALALKLMGLLFLVACSDPFQASDSLGEWGGVGVAAVIEPDSAYFEFDCARASVKLAFDADGSFQGSGIRVPRLGLGRRFTVTFRGRIDGDAMLLVTNMAEWPPYQLKRAQEGALRTCLRNRGPGPAR